jgi:dipeptidase E
VDKGKRQIIAMGGGGFSMEETSLLEEYVLRQSSSSNPKICFVPTAHGDANDSIERFHARLSDLDCETSHLTFFRRTEPDLQSFVMGKDVIYVGGGNTKSMLAVWAEWGLIEILREAWESGIVLAGVSAGSICWFEQGVTDSIAEDLTALDCLGFLPGSNCPHYDGESDRRPSYHQLIQTRKIVPGLALDDGVAAHFVGKQLKSIVTSRPDGKAYAVSLHNGKVEETEMVPDVLS